MPFVIQWVDSCSGTEQHIAILTPAGNLNLTVRQDVITKTDWEHEDYCRDELYAHEIQQQVADYWTDTDKIIHIKLLKQGSDYRNKVWAELCQIPLGETITYSALAKKISSAARAVGNACRDNPYALFIPCHRVVSVAGLGGYNGQTDGNFMEIKNKLLAFEAACRK